MDTTLNNNTSIPSQDPASVEPVVNGENETSQEFESNPTPTATTLKLSTSDPTLLETWNRCWAMVNATPTDFDTWEELVRLVDSQDGGFGADAPQENIVNMRATYDKFLGQFPLCFGYWKKYSDLEFLATGVEGAIEIFERGVKGISTSVDLWIQYCSFVMEQKPDDTDIIVQLFERGAAAVGMDFMPHVFWDKYIEFYELRRDHQNLFKLMTRIIRVPIHQYARFYQQYSQLLESHPLKNLLSDKEYSEYREQLSGNVGSGDTSDEQLEAEMRRKIQEAGALVHAKTAEETNKRWPFEAEIKRPYFHVKPIDSPQLVNWRRYLDFEETEGDVERIRVLYERCLVACALYEEFWLRYAAWTRSQEKFDDLNDILLRAALMVPNTNPSMRFALALLQEERGEMELARQQYQTILRHLPDHIEAVVRFANFERRANLQDLSLAEGVYISQIRPDAHDVLAQTTIVTLYARFLWKMKKDVAAARTVFKTGEGQFDSRFYFSNYLKFEMDQPGEDYEARVSGVFEQIRRSTLPEAIKNDYNQSYLDFLMEFGSCAAKYNELEASLRSPPVYVVESRKRAAAGQADGEPAQKAPRPEDTSAASATVHAGSGHWAQPPHAQAHVGYGYPTSQGYPYVTPSGAQWS